MWLCLYRVWQEWVLYWKVAAVAWRWSWWRFLGEEKMVSAAAMVGHGGAAGGNIGIEGEHVKAMVMMILGCL